MANFTGVIWNLQSIISEFRGITGLPDPSMYSDQQCTNLINYFYQLVLPKELKIFWGYTYHSFYTTPNVDQYLAPTTFQTLNPGVYCDGFPMEWYLDPDNFYSDYPQQTNKTVVAEGTGILFPLTFQIPAFPVLARSVYVTDGIQIAQDNGARGFVNPLNSYAPLTGTINYASGVVTGLIFPVAPALNANIVQTSQTYMPARPRGILFFPTHLLPNSAGPIPPTTPPPPPTTLATRDSVNMFVIRPVPGEVHLIKMQGIQIPAPLINYTDVPFRPDLGPLIALGAALHRFKLFNQMDQYDQYMPEFLRFKDVSMQDTYEELIYTRSTPTF